MADYDDSFNFLFGIYASNFNWNDNPYVQFKVAQLDDTWKPYESPGLTLRNCTESELNKIRAKS